MAIEYRGCSGLVYAPVLTDTVEGITHGEVKPLAPVQNIQREIERSSATSFYDNVASNVRNAEGAEKSTFVIGVPTDDVMSDIEGKYFDPETKIYSDSPITGKYYAVGYKLGEVGDEENESWCWKEKGTFLVTGTEHKTADDGTDVTNISLEYTAIYPQANFTHGGADGQGGKSRGVRIKKNDAVMTEEDFFATVQTIDTVYTAAKA